jgi:hypothetical protein
MELAQELSARGDTVWISRSLAQARQWVRGRKVGQERAGIIASGQARRLAAEGLFVDLKPDIANWMLAPSGDVRSANLLETVQNQYQVQGLELDYTLVCWDGDLRRGSHGWSAWKMSGADWQRDKELGIAKNGYRVLLTRARKGMVVFVPRGDPTGDDSELRAVHVGFNGMKDILGVGCVGLAYAVSIAEGTAPRFGCPVDAETAARFGVPAGTNLEFEVPSGRLQSLRLPTGASLAVGDLRCRGEVTFFEGLLQRCELARGHTLSGVALPAGTRTRFTTEGRIREATIPGRTVWAAGRRWGPEYTPCGVLFFWFEDDGTMRPPESDPSGETCCL